MPRIDWNAVGKFGIPGVIALFLVYRLAMGFDMFESRLKAIEQQHSEQSNHSARTEDLMGRTYMSSERVVFLLRTMCVQAAKSVAERRDCLEER